jgi:hypothetical protein
MGSLTERELEVEDWGEKVAVEALAKGRERFPVVLHFAPHVFVKVKDERLADWERLMRKEFGLAVSASVEDDDGPYGPQPTISGSGDGWDDCD